MDQYKNKIGDLIWYPNNTTNYPVRNHSNYPEQIYLSVKEDNKVYSEQDYLNGMEESINTDQLVNTDENYRYTNSTGGKKTNGTPSATTIRKVNFLPIDSA